MKIINNPIRKAFCVNENAIFVPFNKSASVYATPLPETGLPMLPIKIYTIKQGCPACGFTLSKSFFNIYIKSDYEGYLKPINKTKLINLMRQKPEDFVDCIDSTAFQLSKFINFETPSLPGKVSLDTGKHFSFLGPKEFFPSNNALWFKFNKGEGVYGKNTHLKIKLEEFYFLGKNSYISSLNSCDIQTVNTKNLIKKGLAFHSISLLLDHVLINLYEDLKASNIKKYHNIKRKLNDKNINFHKSLKKIRLLLENSDEHSTIDDTPLLSAIRSIKQKEGFIITPINNTPKNIYHELANTVHHNKMFIRELYLHGKWWKKDIGTLLGFIREENSKDIIPVAILKNWKGYFFLNKSLNYKKRVNVEAVKSIVSTHQLYPTLSLSNITPSKLFSFSIKGMPKEKFLILISSTLIALCSLAIPIASAVIVDCIIAKGQFFLLAQLIFILTSTVLGITIFSYIKKNTILRLESKAKLKLQRAIIAKVLNMPPAFFVNYTSGSITNRIMSIDKMRQIISNAVIEVSVTAIYILANLILMYIYSCQLTLIVLPIILLSVLISCTMSCFQKRIQLKHEGIQGDISGLELQYIGGINKLHSSGSEANAFKNWSDRFTMLKKISWQISKLKCITIAINSTIPLLGCFAIFYFFISCHLNANTSLSSFIGFFLALTQITFAMISLSQLITSLTEVKPLFMWTKPILDSTPELTHNLEYSKNLTGKISIRNLYFSYNKKSLPVLNQINININQGEFIAIVGESGAGKTTLLKLLLGFYKPLTGTIFFDGKSIAKLDINSIRKQCGVVMQNDNLIQGSILTNITGYMSKINIDNAWHAAKLACIDKDIKKMPMQMNTFVPYGANVFSGGQKQRILIARALYKQPRIVMFDEGTSSLDNITQSQIMENLCKINATKIVFAHRLNTIIKADKIFILEKGRIVKAGTYNDLMKNDYLKSIAMEQ